MKQPNGRSVKNKGSAGEREFARMLRDSLQPNVESPDLFYVERTGHSQAAAGGFDLLIPKLGIEVKRSKVVTDGRVRAWWEQTVRQSAEAKRLGILAFRGDQQLWRVMVPGHHVNEQGQLILHSFFELTETYYFPGFCRWYLMNIQPSEQPVVNEETADAADSETGEQLSDRVRDDGERDVLGDSEGFGEGSVLH